MTAGPPASSRRNSSDSSQTRDHPPATATMMSADERGAHDVGGDQDVAVGKAVGDRAEQAATEQRGDEADGQGGGGGQGRARPGQDERGDGQPRQVVTPGREGVGDEDGDERAHAEKLCVRRHDRVRSRLGPLGVHRADVTVLGRLVEVRHDGGPGAPRQPAVVLGQVPHRCPARGRRSARCRRRRAGRWAAPATGRPRHSTAGVAQPGGQLPAAREGVGVGVGQQAGLPRRGERRQGAGRPQRRAPSAACRSCSSCTVHSTSASPPRPSLRCALRVGAPRQPLGLHPRLDPCGSRARRRRRGRPAGHRSGSTSVEERPAQLGVARDRRGPQQRLGLPDQRPALVVGAVGLRACAPAARSCPRAAGRRRARAAGPGRRRRAAGAAPGRPASARLLRRRARRPRRGLVHEQHVGVAAVAHLARRRAGPCRRPAGGSERAAGRCLDRAHGDVERRLQRGGGEVGEGAPDLGRGRAHRSGRRRRSRNSSWRRTARAAVIASSADSLRRRRRASCARPQRLARARAAGPPSSPSMATASGARTSRSAAYRLRASTCASRSAARALVAQHLEVPVGRAELLADACGRRAARRPGRPRRRTSRASPAAACAGSRRAG